MPELTLPSTARTPTPSSGTTLRLALAPGVYLARSPELAVLVRWPRSRSLGAWDEPTATLVEQLSDPRGVEVDAAVLTGHGTDDVLAGLLDDGWLTVTVERTSGHVMTVVPRRPPAARDVPAHRRRLTPSRHVVAVPTADGWSVEAPHSWGDVTFSDVTGMSRCLDPDGREVDVLEQQVLAWCGVLVEPDAEAAELRHRQWSAHELWFHERSRRYGRERGFGGTFWARGTFAPPPLRPPGAGVTVPFVTADPQRWRERSSSLHTVLEDRRSTRRHDDDAPLTSERLGEFLYRTARLRAAQEVDGVEYASKPYPSGGSVYEIELYLLVRHVEGIDPGLWVYDPTAHGLAPVRDGLADPDVAALLREATHSSTVDTPPQVTVLMAPRFGRILWKYEQMGYAVMLKHVGVLMQTMYLVATDMGLAACAIGSGDSDLFSRATGLDPLECTTVGEFLLGTPHPSDTFQERPA
ncbi:MULTISPECIES: SagB family peptide dehydrogenase [Cellulomonas]|uniref:SagB-type dehydrogenase family enzyme n=1 Tax=Cellulomonas oligotrophica TaxID=931536 RepID=A0A7Y9JZA8_9CELL|nr:MULTISPECIES: SagB family peptide dehydrogenase [Cellulomonas]NYD86599.1 SagB-type dehydrogenase family enzyme [Cellulomonas oligotrophica]TQL02263.1 SagB-type dehydrogenase family enzyme [Cellulomonas sp. SLBN-39]GIG32511.1 hypothetical protein Col01nite_16700 [Cellulomonas oligotrophica]